MLDNKELHENCDEEGLWMPGDTLGEILGEDLDELLGEVLRDEPSSSGTGLGPILVPGGIRIVIFSTCRGFTSFITTGFSTTTTTAGFVSACGSFSFTVFSSSLSGLDFDDTAGLSRLVFFLFSGGTATAGTSSLNNTALATL